MKCSYCNRQNALLNANYDTCWDHIRCNDIAQLKKDPSKFPLMIFQEGLSGRAQNEYILQFVQDLVDADAQNVLRWLSRNAEFSGFINLARGLI